MFVHESKRLTTSLGITGFKPLWNRSSHWSPYTPREVVGKRQRPREETKTKGKIGLRKIYSILYLVASSFLSFPPSNHFRTHSLDRTLNFGSNRRRFCSRWNCKLLDRQIEQDTLMSPILEYPTMLRGNCMVAECVTAQVSFEGHESSTQTGFYAGPRRLVRYRHRLARSKILYRVFGWNRANCK